MASADQDLKNVLILDENYAATAADLAADFPDLRLQAGMSGELPAEDVTGLIAQFAPVDDGLLAMLPNLRAVLKLGRSYYNIDIAAVRERGLSFGCVPRKGPNCVAELAMTLILALSKDLIVSNEAVSLGAYRYRG